MPIPPWDEAFPPTAKLMREWAPYAGCGSPRTGDYLEAGAKALETLDVILDAYEATLQCGADDPRPAHEQDLLNMKLADALLNAQENREEGRKAPKEDAANE